MVRHCRTARKGPRSPPNLSEVVLAAVEVAEKWNGAVDCVGRLLRLRGGELSVGSGGVIQSEVVG